MKLTLSTVETIIGGTRSAKRTANINSLLAGLDAYGVQAGLDRAHRLAQYLPQMAHESGRFEYDREIWGPTKAQRGYEGRKDLGNTEPGDGRKFAGRTGIQVTGRENTTAFRDWCHAQGLPAPDFVDTPDLMNTDPWEGLAPIWYWSSRNLNRYADEGNIEMITKRINGGLNGYDDRITLYTRAALVLLGYKLTAGATKRFQTDHGLTPDDIAGPETRKAMHRALMALDDTAAPVPPPVIVPVPVPVIPAVPDAVESQPVPDYTFADYAAIIREALEGIERLSNEQA